ncbi:MAG TPA: glycosyltransferase family 87 protein [Candidatus Limnocylindrales bacterium]|nr:glycosyltransferase family 87 protein [Candidatus Limnocylindrales bacterium]
MSLPGALTVPRLSSPAIRRGLRDGLVVAGLLFAAYLFVVAAPQAGTFGFDAFAYWAVDLTDPYGILAGGLGAFTYTPVAARAAAPFALLAFWQFLFLWDALLVGTLIWLGGRRTLMLLAFPPVAIELYHGNIHLLIAAAIVLGFRYPAAWAFPVLTKVTPGIGLLWFAARREWRSLGIALVAIGVLTALSLLIDGRLWSDWLSSIVATADGAPLNQFNIPIPLWLRLPVAALVVIWGARTDRYWTLPVAVALAMPALWITAFAVLAAIPRSTRLHQDRSSWTRPFARTGRHLAW